jgi:hypothetical protein
MTDAIDVDLPLEQESPGRAREHLNAYRGLLDETSFIDLRLLVSELVVEALKATPDAQDRKIELRAGLDDDRVRVEVSSAAYRLPSPHPQPGDVGWGISLVKRLSGHWGFRHEPEKATVWLDIP